MPCPSSRLLNSYSVQPAVGSELFEMAICHAEAGLLPTERQTAMKRPLPGSYTTRGSNTLGVADPGWKKSLSVAAPRLSPCFEYHTMCRFVITTMWLGPAAMCGSIG